MLSLFLPEQINTSKVKVLQESTPGATIAPAGYTRVQDQHTEWQSLILDFITA